MKTAKVLEKEHSVTCPDLIHYTLLYRGREYTETRHVSRTQFNIGDEIVVDTYRGRGGFLGFIVGGKLNEESN